jgi:hypothetical protein
VATYSKSTGAKTLLLAATIALTLLYLWLCGEAAASACGVAALLTLVGFEWTAREQTGLEKVIFTNKEVYILLLCVPGMLALGAPSISVHTMKHYVANDAFVVFVQLPEILLK